MLCCFVCRKPFYRLRGELITMLSEPPVGVSAAPKRQHHGLKHWVATVDGPSGSVYEGGRFYFDVKFPNEYPFAPPKVTCMTKIYHCNFASNGAICLDILKDKWSPALTISTILLSLSALLVSPNPEDPLDKSIADMYIQSKENHDKTARDWTARYAQHISSVGKNQTQAIITRYLNEKGIKDYKLDPIKQEIQSDNNNNSNNNNNNKNNKNNKNETTQKEKANDATEKDNSSSDNNDNKNKGEEANGDKSESEDEDIDIGDIKINKNKEKEKENEDAKENSELEQEK